MASIRTEMTVCSRNYGNIERITGTDLPRRFAHNRNVFMDYHLLCTTILKKSARQYTQPYSKSSKVNISALKILAMFMQLN
jgi:hypothetical protein